MNIMQQIEAISPVKATIVSGGSIIGNILVWLDAIKGPAGSITAVFGAVTGILVSIYWLIKIYNEVRPQKHKPRLTKNSRCKSSKQKSKSY